MRFPTILVLALVVACDQGGKGAGGGGTDTRYIEEAITSFGDAANHAAREMHDLSRTVGGVKDKQSAEAAKPKVEAIATRLGAIADSLKDLGEPTEEEKTQTADKMKKASLLLARPLNAYTKLAMESEEIGEALNEPLAACQSHLKEIRRVLGG